MFRMIRSMGHLVGAVGVAVSIGVFGGASGGVLASEPGTATAGTWRVQVEGARLSVDAHDAPLGRLLRELARQASFSVSVREQVAQEPVAAHFSSIPLEEGIHKLLQGKEYAIIHGGSARPGRRGGASDIREVLVFSRLGTDAKSGDGWVDYSTRATPSLTHLTQQAHRAPTPGQRARALEELSMVANDEVFVPILARSLRDEDPGVRGLAMDFLEGTLSPLPQGPVAEIARADESPQLRAKALALLAYRMQEGAVELLQQALQDPDSRIRELAAELLSDLGVGVSEEEGREEELEALPMDTRLQPA